MNLDSLGKNWDALGEEDALWAILADPARRGNRWDIDEFFATGVRDVEAYVADLDRLVPGAGRGSALDFGCGAGRLTQALAEQFGEVDGIDIAPSMIGLAERHNRKGDRVRYHLNQKDDLGSFADATFDFVLSIIVLQHMENRYKESYLREFVRVLKPGGVAMFTIPSHSRLTPTGLVYRLPNPVLNFYRHKRYGNRGVMELHGMRRGKVDEVVAACGASVVDVDTDPLAGGPWHSYRYVVKRDG